MRIASLAATAKIGCMILLAHGVASAAEINVLSVGAFRPALTDLGGQFERATGHKLLIKYDATGAVKRHIEAGEAFDVAILNVSQVDDLIKQGKIIGGSRADIARSGVGMFVRAGAARPDIGSVEAFKRTLLNAKSVAYSGEGAAGVHFAGLLTQLGIAEDMKPKLRSAGLGTLQAVANGEAEMGVVAIAGAAGASGVELVGPLPSEVQHYIGYTAVLGAAAKQPDAAQALVTLLASEQALPVLKAKGMEPFAR
jgi:molybdate transport system substrate-binding protein